MKNANLNHDKERIKGSRVPVYFIVGPRCQTSLVLEAPGTFLVSARTNLLRVRFTVNYLGPPAARNPPPPPS